MWLFLQVGGGPLNCLGLLSRALGLKKGRSRVGIYEKYMAVSTAVSINWGGLFLWLSS